MIHVHVEVERNIRSAVENSIDLRTHILWVLFNIY